MAKLNQKQLDLKNYMIKNDWILEEVMEVVFIECGSMNTPGINQRCDELDVRVLKEPQFDGSILVLSSDLLKNGVNVPRCILGHAVDDTSMMYSCRQIMGEAYVQFTVKNILKVHNRNHPEKRNYCLQMEGDRICTQEKGPNQRGGWYENLKYLANVNLSTFGKFQDRFNTYEDFKNIMESK